MSHLSPTYPSDADQEQNISLALPGFYCKNKGHQPSYTPFLCVNDGVCDYDLCCDGSDEWQQVGGIKCEDKCKEIGKEWKKQNEQNQKAIGAATKKKRELVSSAAILRKEIEDRLQTLQTQIEGSTIKAKDLEVALAEVERRERGKVVRAPGKGSKLGVLVGLAKDRIAELRGALVDVRAYRDISMARVTELEAILNKFKEEYNPNFNDEGVKRAVRAWEDYAARDKPAGGDAAHERDLDEIAKPDGETGAIKWEEWEDAGEDDDVAVRKLVKPGLSRNAADAQNLTVYKFEEYLPKAARDWVDQKLRDLRVLLVENGILAASHNVDASESKAVTDARDGLKSAQDDLNNLQNQLNGDKEDLDKNYGQDDVFRALKGQCVFRDAGEYTYELCWFESTKQKSRKGGGDTGLGDFVRIDSIMVDDDLPPDGKGLGSGERVALRYENGQHCWNGPNRSTLVVLACAEKDEIWRVVEEEKCVYRMEVGTPAVCNAIGNGKQNSASPKDEL